MSARVPEDRATADARATEPPARPRTPLLVTALLAVSAGPAAAEGPALRVEAGPGYDTNVGRVEGDDRRADGLLRLVVDLQEALAPAAGWRLAAGYHAGAKRFFEVTEEDAIAQRAEGSVARAAGPLELRLDASLRDRTTRDPLEPRDFLRAGGGPGAELRLGDVRFGVRGFGERFRFKPDERLDATALGGSASVTWRPGAVQLGASAAAVARRFDGPRLVRIGSQPGGLPVVEAEPGSRREDRFWRGSAALRHLGAWIGAVEYAYEVNESDSHGGGFRRHALDLSSTVELPLGVLASGQLGLQRVVYADPQFISPERFVEDEGRSSVSLRLERPFESRWAVVGQVGAWFSPFGAGPAFGRETVALGLAYSEEP